MFHINSPPAVAARALQRIVVCVCCCLCVYVRVCGVHVYVCGVCHTALYCSKNDAIRTYFAWHSTFGGLKAA
jgi:hypothetical protein